MQGRLGMEKRSPGVVLLSHGVSLRSIIGAVRLNFRVRDGTGCIPHAIDTRGSDYTGKPRDVKGRLSRLQHAGRARGRAPSSARGATPPALRLTRAMGTVQCRLACRSSSAVEHHLAKVGVAGSNPVSCSLNPPTRAVLVRHAPLRPEQEALRTCPPACAPRQCAQTTMVESAAPNPTDMYGGPDGFGRASFARR